MALQARVFVVDDEEPLRLSLSRILKFHGFLVESAGDAFEAIDKIAAERFDVILTDLRMSGPEDGLRIIEAARASHPDTITFLMSAYPNLTGTASRLNLRPDEIVLKPIDIPGLIRRMQERLAGQMPASRVV